MDWRALLNPGRGPDAPSSRQPTGATRERARRNPRGPQPGESFATWHQRTAPPPAPAPEGPAAFGLSLPRPGPAYRQAMREQAERGLRQGELRPDTRREAQERRERRRADEPPSPAQVVGEGAVREFNRPSMILGDIPMGLPVALPRIGQPYQTEGASGRAIGYEMTAVRGASGEIVGVPGRLEIGTFRWGRDQRRPVREVLDDVTIATGAPQNMLYMIGRRENYPHLSLYDQPRTEGGGVSSARGPHQFTNGTFRSWIDGVGEMYGVPATMGAAERADLVNDPRFSGAMAAEYARFNWQQIRNRTPDAPPPSIADLYLAHHGGDEGVALAIARREGHGSRPAIAYYTNNNSAAVRNHMSDFYVDGDVRRPRTVDQYYNWMVGADPNSPHQRDYDDDGRRGGLPTDPVEFEARMDGSREAAEHVGPMRFGLPSDSVLARSSQFASR